MAKATLDISEQMLACLRQDAEGFAREMRLAAAVKWYELRRVSQAGAAEIAGLSRHDFVMALAQFGVTPFQATAEELLEEAGRE